MSRDSIPGIHFPSMIELKLKDQAWLECLSKSLPALECLKKATILDLTVDSYGISSVMAAKAGAPMVYHLPCTDEESEMYCSGYPDPAAVAYAMVRQNGFEPYVKILENDDLDEMPFKKVDCIIADWFGSCLFVKSRLLKFLKFRDRFLKRAPHGQILPRWTSLHIVGVLDVNRKYWAQTYWERHPYEAKLEAIKEALITVPWESDVSKNHLATTSECLAEFDMVNFSPYHGVIVKDFQLEALKDCILTGFALYFKTSFSADSSIKKIEYSIGPDENYATWKPSLLHIKKAFQINKGDVLSGTFKLDFEDVSQLKGMFASLSYKAENEEFITTSYTFEPNTD